MNPFYQTAFEFGPEYGPWLFPTHYWYAVMFKTSLVSR